ncbi:MAG: branched-chain amino acid ABC transporter permease [Actinobacteria bacterium]|jgi:branched-chain amino acid transport system permease protein|nr:branched-chain amino acid ABC transporter permease [Actinomycetota bacterium]NBQ59844.1 branched-chain amino acid ABC transporter permease [Actinomycetota bacterium]NBY82428.1 branched-chain amino acid ABC transporter permease [Actinomycetota bacterium]NCU78037.1 branched-chain amino acid ABC transporter permease [Actinomycetota bacterium]NDG24635.1 branched-chain amino acid ABC transporter permease [Actinomycetota bacterium]
MLEFFTAVLTSLSTGAIYALMSTALVLVWRSTRVINFAQAGQAVLSTYIGYEVTTRSGSYWIGFIGAVLSGAIIGAGIDRFFMRPIFKRVKSGPIVMIAPVVATLGLLGIIQAIVGFVWGLNYLTIAAPVSTEGLKVFGSVIAFSPFNLMVLISVTLSMILLTILFQKTNLGLALRASAYSPEIAKLSGIKVEAIRTIGWALAGAAGGLAGMLYVPGSYLYPNSMEVLLVFGFIAAVIGGLDSLFGAVAGAMILGFAINFSTTYISYKLVFPTAFVILILVLLIKPGGVFSSKKGRKD